MRLLYVVLPGAVVGGIALAGLTAGGKTALQQARNGETGDTGASAADAGAPPAEPRMIPLSARVGLSLAAGLTTSGMMALTLVFDRAVEQWLVRRGVPKPRWWMSGAFAAYSLMLDAAMDAKAPAARTK